MSADATTDKNTKESPTESYLAEATPVKTPIEARDDFLKYLGTLPEEHQLLIYRTADKLLTLVTQPHMLNAFVLANAELAALHYEGNLTAPKIARVGLPDSFKVKP